MVSVVADCQRHLADVARLVGAHREVVLHEILETLDRNRHGMLGATLRNGKSPELSVKVLRVEPVSVSVNMTWAFGTTA
jgi:hypothetical protein